jgi:DNA invertase Pin-like site-specific DNA recombinase
MEVMVDQMPLRAANLGRVSKKDRKKKNERDRARSVAEQHAANEAAIKANGHLEVARYQDEESASRFATKAREDWLRLVSDIEAGNIDILYLWETTRGSRKAGEFIDFLDLCRDQKVLIHITNHGRTYDMNVRRDRKTLVEEAVDAEDDSEKIHDNVTRALRANREAGLPHGICKWGYQRVYHPRTGALLGQEPIPDQAAVCEEIITRAAKSEPISAIFHDLEARTAKGLIPAPPSGKWTRRQVQRIATSIVYIGKIRVDGELIDAKWPAIVDETIFWAAQHVLTADGRKTTKPGKAKYLLSYVMVCGTCGKGVCGDPPRNRRKSAIYVCPDNHCSIVMESADSYITEVVTAKFRRPSVVPFLMADDSKRIMEARAEAARLRAELDEWAAADISPRAYKIRESKLMPLIEAAERRAEELAVPLALGELVGAGDQIHAMWENTVTAARRDIVRALFESIKLMPGKAGSDRGKPARERITLVWLSQMEGVVPTHDHGPSLPVETKAKLATLLAAPDIGKDE